MSDRRNESCKSRVKTLGLCRERGHMQLCVGCSNMFAAGAVSDACDVSNVSDASCEFDVSHVFDISNVAGSLAKSCLHWSLPVEHFRVELYFLTGGLISERLNMKEPRLALFEHLHYTS